MSRRKVAEETEATVPEPSRTAGGCVLLGLAAIAVAALYAVSETALVLAVWAVGAAALWRAVKRHVSDSSAPPPPRGGRPSCRTCAGHELVSVTPSGTQKGMLIYQTASPERPNHTHIHIGPGQVNER